MTMLPSIEYPFSDDVIGDAVTRYSRCRRCSVIIGASVKEDHDRIYAAHVERWCVGESGKRS